ncbi:reverse transcriptase domain-containing protein [Oceanobacillus rekensis]|uniref:reverse transcriptase domain-containing protein n=1 Tax=Oceanobacillus rekensis TaxID=937927 RepID=UPI000B442F90|nr:reverse transcriptase domain-containing protein [Oceanobacillus rekensis]
MTCLSLTILTSREILQFRFVNKGASGVDGVTVEELKEHLKEHKDELRAQIRKRKYQPAPALRVEIQNGKMRKLGILTVVDRLVQQAISQKLSPIFEKQFSEYSYGFRPERSCEMAIIQALYHTRFFLSFHVTVRHLAFGYPLRYAHTFLINTF